MASRFDPKLAASLADEIRLTAHETLPATAQSDSGDAPLVLVVDDNPDVRAYVARQVRRHYRVVEAADGEQALARMRESVPDLVVSDLAMPVMDGIALPLRCVAIPSSSSCRSSCLRGSRDGEPGERTRGWGTTTM